MYEDPLQKEPPTEGKIQLRTSMGDVQIELWSKEAPKACRNIIQLALEGYYEDQIFHRIVKDFIVQTGDPTGTGRGGESIYPGGSFEDEFHHRLKFNKRGLVAMANAGTHNSNDSQFFITLGPTPELQGKHTIFGRVLGAGMFTILSISEVEVDAETARPKFPPKLLGIDVIDNPFDDIQPRTTKAEKTALRERAKKEKQAQKEKKRKAELEKSSGGAVKKNKKVATLLSFGEGEEEESSGKRNGAETKLNKKVMSSFDALGGTAAAAEVPARIIDPASEPVPSKSSKAKGKEKAEPQNGTADLSRLRVEHHSSSAKGKAEQKIKDLERDLLGGMSKSTPVPDETEQQKEKKPRLGKDWLQEERAKYASRKEKGKGERDALRKLQSFQEKLRSKVDREASKAASEQLDGDEEVFPEMREYGMSDEDDEADDWASFRAHRFEAKGNGKEGEDGKDRFSVDDYEVIDPRTSSKLALELGFGKREARETYQKEREKERLRAEGRQGRDYVPDRRELNRERDHSDPRRDRR